MGKTTIITQSEVSNFIAPEINGDIIFDVDGTLMDIEHRKHFVQDKPKDWKQFMAEMVNDTPRKEIFAIAHEAKKNGHRIIVSSGRNERDRALTTKQLNSEGLFPDIFLMRADDDYRSDDLVKKDLLGEMIAKGFNPTLAVDDRNQVVEMWRANDIPCFQCVEDGNF